MTKTITEKYQKLDEISHVLLRPGRYIGSINPHTEIGYTFNLISNKMEKNEITYTPALLKVFDEVVSNSVDFSKTEDGKHLTAIKVSVDKMTGEISVFDDGGIHVVKHKEHDQWIPEMIFELRSGSNFDDEESDNDYSTGQNGEGAALTSIFSTSFTVETSDGYNKFHQIHADNSRSKSEPKISKSNSHYTKITWTPDYSKFNLDGLDEGNFQSLLKRTVDLAGCNSNLKIYFNGILLKIKSFEDYIKLYTDEFVFESNQEWKVGISHSTTGFEHLSFVNSTLTKVGGPHVEYISAQITNKLREYFKKKYKVDIKPSDIKNHFNLYIDASIKKPRYSSQTKESLITEIKNFGTSIDLSDKFIKAILKTEIVQSILDWISAKEKAQLMADLRKANKNLDKADPKRVEGFHDAGTRDRSEASLFISEGISALSGLLSGRDPKTMACFALRGKPINVTPMELKDILDNKEFKNIMTITGLQFGVKVEDISDLRFSKIVAATDSDLDGYCIRGLLLNAFYKFWPELFDMNVIYILNTPIVKVKYKKDLISFYSLEEFHQWKDVHVNEKFESRYYKGLGTSSSSEWKEYLSNLEQNLEIVTTNGASDSEMFHLHFSKDSGMADKRKDWLGIEDLV